MNKILAAVFHGAFPALLIFLTSPADSQKLPMLGKSSVKEVVRCMSLEEKARMLVGTGWIIDIPDSTLKRMGGFNPFAPKADNDTAYRSMINRVQKILPGSAGTTAELLRFGITPLITANGPAGIWISPTRRGSPGTFYCTAFPVGTLLASSWDKDLIRRVGEAYGREEREYGVDIALGPGMNIQRNPLCGRNFEYFSEDPYLAGKIGAAMVNGIESQGVGTSVKHFAANNQETNRNSLNTKVSDRALREIYLEGFRIVVEEAQPWTVMSSYNKINGTYTAECYDLLTNVLRNDWGFKGFVMTDWYAGRDIISMVKAGNDLIMPGSVNQCRVIVEAVQTGKLDIEDVDRNVERILNIVLESPRFKSYIYSNKPDLNAGALMSRTAAAEGMILLKNSNSTLPLPAATKAVAAFGNGSYEVVIGGSGSGDVNEAYSINPSEGLKNAGYDIDKSLRSAYIDYIKNARKKKSTSVNLIAELFGAREPVPEMDIKAEIAENLAKTNDAAIITICKSAGEGQDRKIENDFNMTGTEKALIRTVSDAFHARGKKVIVVLNIGGVIETESWKNIPDAILLAWQPGQEAGNAIADIISGKVNPSGKLAISFPVAYEDVPSSGNFPGSGSPPEVTYEEGIFVGYRYYNTFGVRTSYEFGYGLSYTQFSFTNLKLNSKIFRDKIILTIDVKNIGNYPGREVAELYLSAPAAKLFKPESELKGFEKTRLLQPGEKQTLTFTLSKRSLASFDASGSSWIAEAGLYTVKIGASSTNIRLTGTFTLPKELIVKKETSALVPTDSINELKPAR